MPGLAQPTDAAPPGWLPLKTAPDPFVVEAGDADEAGETDEAEPVVDPAGAAGGVDTDSALAEQVDLGRWDR